MILDTKNEVDKNKYLFLQSEFRNVNYYTIKSSMGSTDRIRTPSDLYKLYSDESDLTEDQKEYLLAPLTPEELRIIHNN
jgi:hypothetical protein